MNDCILVAGNVTNNMINYVLFNNPSSIYDTCAYDMRLYYEPMKTYIADTLNNYSYLHNNESFLL